MRLLNHKYENHISLAEFIHNNSIPSSNSALIQILFSNSMAQEAKSIKDELKNILPNSSIIASSTAGTVSDGQIIDNAIIISFSIFDHSTTVTKSYCDLSIDDIIEQLSDGFINERTKLLICFADTFLVDSENLLRNIQSSSLQVEMLGMILDLRSALLFQISATIVMLLLRL